MEKKTIIKIAVCAVLVCVGLLFALGVGRGGNTTYQLPGPYTAESTNDFSTVQVAMTIQEEKITDCAITSSGDSDLMTDEIRAEWAQSIVDNQSAENDVISSASLTYSAASVKEAVADILGQAGLPTPEPTATPEPEPKPEPEAEAPAGEAAAGLTDGTYSAEAKNDFSTVSVEATVEGGRITAATVASDGGATDLLTDELRDQWGQAIVEAQSADADAITGATLTFSAASVKEAMDDILAQAQGGEAGEAAAGLTDGTYSAEAKNDFSTVSVEATVEGGKITAATVASDGGATDLLTDELREQWGQAIVEAQSADADAITGATLTFSAASVKEAVDDILAQAAGSEGTDGANDEKIAELEAALAEAEARAEEAEARVAEAEAKVAEAEAKVVEAEAKVAELEAAAEASEDSVEAVPAAEEAPGLTDGAYSAEAKNDFSTVSVEATVEGGKITAATVASDGGATDLLTDELREQWGQAIVDAQSADTDAITGATLAFSAASVKEAVDDILAQAQGGEAAETAAPEADEAPAEAANAGLSAFARPRPVLDGAAEVETESAKPEAEVEETLTEEAPAEAANADLSAFARPRPVLDGAAEAGTEAAKPEAEVEKTVTEEAPTEATNADLSAFARPRPVLDTAIEAEAEAEEAPAEAANSDLSAFARPRPVPDAAIEAETEAEEAPAEAANSDLSAFARPRPVLDAAAEAEPEAEEAETAEALTDEQRLASILPHVVTTMGDNRENSYVIDYLEQDPYLTNIYEGYGFAKDYGSARGHEYTLEDVAKTQRPHPKANCITCKTPDLHKMIEEQGVAVYSMPFDEVYSLMTNNVSCYTCHGDDMGNGGQLAVTHQYVNEALGENVSTIAPATLSCGQCHIEYYFTPADSETMMPYHSVEEMTPQAILDYYDALGFADWTQESTGTAMLKAQHPEMETFLQGKHAAFLTCADCHMPPETTDDGVAYRSHMLISPLENEALLASCAQCHGETDMVEFVRGIQESVTARETEVGNKLSAMKDALAEANASGDWSEDDLNAVRKLHREAQWFFDYCYVENSEGAHNSQLSLSCLDTSEEKIDEAMQLLDSHTT